MAKRGTLDHPKNKRLARILGVCPGVTLGMLETVWHWIGDYRKDGAITLVDLEDALDSGGWLAMFSAETVAAAMTNVERECIWLERLPDGRFYVHDWHEHCDDSVNRWLARARRHFANGTRPDLTRLTKDERESIRAHFDSVECAGNSTETAPTAEPSTQDAPSVRTEGALPRPRPKPEPKPEVEESGDSSIVVAGEKIVEGELIDDPPNWFEMFWDTYPPRAGDRKRAASEEKFHAAVKRGVDPREIVAGAERYRAWCDATRKTKTEFVQMATTWLNNRAWLEPFEIPPDAPSKPGPSRRESPSEVYARLERDRLARVGGAA